MTWWGWLLFGTVALWLAPGSFWRPCALALLLQWGISETLYQWSGERMPMGVYLVGDMAVVACVLLARSHWSDWLVIAPYPIVWWLYAMPESREQWITLYWLALAQMLIAGPWPQIQRTLSSVSHGSSKPSGVQFHEGA